MQSVHYGIEDEVLLRVVDGEMVEDVSELQRVGWVLWGETQVADVKELQRGVWVVWDEILEKEVADVTKARVARGLD